MSERPDLGRNPGSEPDSIDPNALASTVAFVAPVFHPSAEYATTSVAGKRSALPPRRGLAWLTLLAWCVAFAVVVYAAAWVVREGLLVGAPITVSVDGHVEVVRSARPDVSGLLADLGLSLRPEDALTPAPNTPLAKGLVVTVERARPGLVSTDGRLAEVFTRSRTVAGLLAAANIAVSDQDEVVLDGQIVPLDTPLPRAQVADRHAGFPLGRKWNLPRPTPVHLSIHRAVPITVDDGSVPYTIFTTAPTVGDALLREQVTVYLGDRVQPSLGVRVNPGMRIHIERSTPVILALDGRTVQTRTRGKTVGAALMDLGVVVAGMDDVSPALHEQLADHTPIKVTRVSEVTLVERAPIPFESISAPDDTLEIDQTRLAQAGKDGEHRKRWKVRYEDGQEVSRLLIDEWQAAAPVTRITSYGRMLVSRTLDTEAGALTYWRKIRMYATSYSPARAGTPKSAPWYGRTRLGLPLRKGLVAVDPTLIPLRSQLYIPGYGIAMAADTGGGVRGKMIDLGFEDHDYVSYHWWIDVYVLEPRSSYAKIVWVLPNYPPPSFPRNR